MKNKKDSYGARMPLAITLIVAAVLMWISKYMVTEVKSEVLNGSKILYTRDFTLNNGTYGKEKYVGFVAFINAITKADISKVVLVKNKE